MFRSFFFVRVDALLKEPAREKRSREFLAGCADRPGARCSDRPTTKGEAPGVPVSVQRMAISREW